ncbi:hypothetical protein [Mesorhizobium sp. NZP2077]|uniref:hypothetical protein n=1 Tax=Mesorhizobium sp. NZP2077 TaxID=2483404 RepID=UPI00155817A8|nr:hypothetical protein [Mesorhizobium sp. NZP2077]QKD20532.1 hypothetical protein HGP13_36890 [Mesorhizobium sp. NZP2077]
MAENGEQSIPEEIVTVCGDRRAGGAAKSLNALQVNALVGQGARNAAYVATGG